MSIVSVEHLQPLTPAFARTARRMVLLLAAFSLLAFGVGSKALLGLQFKRQLTEQAELCAAAIGSLGDLHTSGRLAELQARTDRLVAVALLTSDGHAERVFPDRPAQRAMVQTLLAGTAEAEVESPVTEETEHVVGVIVPYTGGTTPSSQRMLVVLRAISDWVAWLPMMGTVTFAVVVIAFLRLRTLQRWFDDHIARPLQDMAGAVDPQHRGRHNEMALPQSLFRETAALAETFHELLGALSDSHSQRRQLETEVERRIKSHEAGLDKQLRFAKDQATTDPLTGLRNRRFLDEHFPEVIERQRQRGQELCAVMIDLDNFKQYNDSHGHQVGDALLKFVGALLRGSVRPDDYAVRYGGDEFFLLLPGTPLKGAVLVADRMIKMFGQYAGQLDRSIGLSMSAGVASLQENQCSTGQELVARADAALYSVKFTNKSAVACWPVAEKFLGRRVLSKATRGAPTPPDPVAAVG